MADLVLISVAVLLRIISNPLGNVFQKQLTAKGNSAFVINFVTYLLLSIFCIFVAISRQWQTLPPQFWIYSVLGGVAGALGNGFLVRALEKGNISVLGPINSYKSIVAIIIGVFLLKEIPNLWSLLGIALIIYGSYFVLETTGDKFSVGLLKRIEIQYRLWAMVLTAIEAVFIKKVIVHSSTTISFISWCWFGALFSFILLLSSKVNFKKLNIVAYKPNLFKYFSLVVCIGTMQFTTNYALKNMPVGYALSLFQLSTIVSVILGHKFFEEKDILKKLIGSTVMIAGSVVIILFKDK